MEINTKAQQQMEYVRVMEYINLKAGIVMRESLKMIYLKVKEKSYTIEEHGIKETLKPVKLMVGACINIRQENIMKDNGKMVNGREKVNLSLRTVTSMKVILSTGNLMAMGY